MQLRGISNPRPESLEPPCESVPALLLQMCLHWLTQCFWNYLDWTEICHYVSTCVLMGPDYQVYMCVAVFKHLQPDVLQRTQSQELQVFLKVRGAAPQWFFKPFLTQSFM